jgi:hypothetical protein
MIYIYIYLMDYVQYKHIQYRYIYIVLFVADKDVRFKKRIEQVLVRKLKMVRGPPFPAHTGTGED